jgi:hypothetical protein
VANRTVERQFAEHAEAFDGIPRDGADRRHQPERDGEIVMTPLLWQVGGSEIDGDALGRQREPNGVQCAAHPFAAFRHRLVRKSDNGEGGEPRPDLDLLVDGARLDPFESDRRDPREHRENPRPSFLHFSQSADAGQEQSANIP